MSNTLFEEKIFSFKSKFKKKDVLSHGLNGKVLLAKFKEDKKLYAIKVSFTFQKKL